MNHEFGIAIEGLVAALLLLTVGYCMLLNKRLKMLKADEQSLKATIAELITATEIAERAIGGLKLAVREVNGDLSGQLSAGTDLSRALSKQLIEGETLFRRLSRIVAAARPGAEAEPVKLPTAKSIVAAAQAFSERRRPDGLAA